MNVRAKSAKLDGTELKRLIGLYDLEQYLFEKVTRRFEEEGTLSPYDFFAIVIWKSNRAKTKVKRGLINGGKTVGELMQEVSQAEDLRKVKILCDIQGIWLSIASAILTVCYPKRFTVLDYRAWEVLALQDISVENLPKRYPQSPKNYLQYCEVCRRFADRVGLPLRDLDRALWAKSWEDGLLALIGE